MNLANKITISRFFLVLLFLVSSFFEISYLNRTVLFFTTIVFLLSSITDFLDGYIARKYSQITNLGKLLDPLADKVMVTAAYLVLLTLNRIDIYTLLLIISREYTISIIRAIAASSGVLIAASNSGKIKTVFQIFSILCLLLNIPYAIFIYYIAVILTLSSGLEYILASKKIFIEK